MDLSMHLARGAAEGEVARIDVNSYTIFYHTKNNIVLDPGIQLLDTNVDFGNDAALLKKFRQLLPYDVHEKIILSAKLTAIGHAKYASNDFESKMLGVRQRHLRMFLIHYPAAPNSQARDASNKEVLTEAWLVVSEGREPDLVNAFGMHDYINHIIQLTEVVAIGPSVNTMLWYSFYNFKFAGGVFNNLYLKNNVVVEYHARQYNLSASEILFLWALQRGESVVPKPHDTHFQMENMRLHLRLTEDDLTRLDIGILRSIRGPLLSNFYF